MSESQSRLLMRTSSTARASLSKTSSHQGQLRSLLLLLALLTCVFALPTSISPVDDDGDVVLDVGQHNRISNSNWALGIVLIIGGLVEVFYGFKFIRLTLVLAGFLSWAIAAMIIMVAIRWDLVFTTFLPQYYYMWVWLVAGLTGAILSFRFWDLGVTFTGAFGGFALAMGIIAVANLSITNAGRYVILGILVLGGATIATFFERLFIIIWTSCGGAYMFMFGVDQFAQVGYREIIVIFDFTGKTLQYHPNLHVYLMLGFSLVLASLGIGWEFWHHEKPVLMDRRAIFRIYGRPFGKRPHKLIGQRIHHHLKTKSDLYAYFLGCVCLQRTTIEDVLYNSDSCDASDIGHPVPGESPISGDQPSSTEEGHAGVTKEPITVISASSDNSPLKSAPLADSAEKHPELPSGISTSVDSSANSAVLSAASPSSEDISGSTAHLESSKDPSAQASRTTHIITSTSSHTESHHTESDAMFNPIPAARPEPHHPLFSPNLGARTLEMLRLVTEDLTPGNTIPRDYVPLNERAAVTAPVSFIWPPSVTASSASASARSSTSFLNDEQVDSQGLHIFEFSENTESDYESQEPEILESGQSTPTPHAA